MAEADTHRAGLQCARAFVCQRGAMEACPDSDLPFAQKFRQFLTVHFGNKRHCSSLVFSGKHLKTKLFQSLPAAFRLALLTAEDLADPRPFQVLQACGKAGDPRYIQGPRL